MTRQRYPDTPLGWAQTAKYGVHMNLTQRGGHKMTWRLVGRRSKNPAFRGRCSRCKGGIQVTAGQLSDYKPLGGYSIGSRLPACPKQRGR